jgi:hypothetical protein
MSKPAPRSISWLTADWVSLLVALGLAALVRAGVIGGVPW